MGSDGTFKGKATQIASFLLRVVAGLLFFEAGSVIHLGWFGGMPGALGVRPAITSQIGFGGVLEFYGGILIMLGLFTRPVAFLLSGEMAVAYWQFHFPRGFWPVQNHGEPAVLLCFIFLLLAAQGGGEWSADEWLRRRLARMRT